MQQSIHNQLFLIKKVYNGFEGMKFQKWKKIHTGGKKYVWKLMLKTDEEKDYAYT